MSCDDGTLTSYLRYDGKDMNINGRVRVDSMNPIVVNPGATSIIYVFNVNTGSIRTIIGSYVNNVRMIRDDGRLPPAIRDNITRKNRLRDLDFRSPIAVGEDILRPGTYSITIVYVIPDDVFYEYCEREIYGTTSEMCGITTCTSEEYQSKIITQQFFFNFSLLFFVAVIILLLIIILVLHFTRSL